MSDEDPRGRELLEHTLAAIAYRMQKAVRDAPAHYADFSAGHQVRTPVELVRHMTSLMGYVRTMFVGGSYPPKPHAMPTFTDELSRFHTMLASVAKMLKSGAPLRDITVEQLVQGPFADVLTHIGQLALLRRLAGAPVAPENFIHADVRRDRLGVHQAPPAKPDDDWAERPG